ncbi:MAG: hypothetical protein A3H98_12845 [Bacteroidetes bacterium RIFCSPLOWO2_02_FULL_36_8]|nr:MAG: hypothetical protein A3H98_12845 [Bacteroidetes bacterium RIFCSPLOWO2_02_FULL_36_8]OFY70674.1 MAG: hypothetical protein A3G23_08090 [Bacteroidetes bacterium RIFCSPLOWO2_12_FULL_37_12]
MFRRFRSYKKTIPISGDKTISCCFTNDKPNLETIVLLNGSVFHLHQWDYFIRFGFFMNKDFNYRLLRYDYPGTGNSLTFNPRWEIWECADDLNRLLTENKIDKVHLYGISKGTLVAQAFALKYPEKVISIAGWGWFNLCYSRLIDLKTVNEKRIRLLELMKDYWILPLDKEIYKKLWRLTLSKMIFKRYQRELNIIHRIVAFYIKRLFYRIIHPTPIKIIHDWFWYALHGLPKERSRFRRMFKRIYHLPVLIQHSENDETLPVNMSKELCQLIPQAKLSLYGGFYTHISVMFHPLQSRKIAGEYLKFLKHL